MGKECVLQTEKLKKSFGKQTVLSDVNLNLEKGKIYGLIGKNGAGKTTLMRLICNLSFPSSGKIELFGKKIGKEYTKNLSKIGVLIEYPSLFGKMSSKQNLKINRIIRGLKNTDSDDELLKSVGLGNVGKKKVKDFSLGMRQRLGIAIAMQSKPEFLILDEPVNGLDPVGVVEIRNLIKMLSEKYGMTILISSHNLPELYQTATDYIIMDSGVIKKEISQSELETKCQKYIELECDDAKIASDYILNKLKKGRKNSATGEINVKMISNTKVIISNLGEEKVNLMRSIFNDKCGFKIKDFSTHEESLESYFLKVIGGNKDV